MTQKSDAVKVQKVMKAYSVSASHVSSDALFSGCN